MLVCTLSFSKTSPHTVDTFGSGGVGAGGGVGETGVGGVGGVGRGVGGSILKETEEGGTARRDTGMAYLGPTASANAGRVVAGTHALDVCARANAELGEATAEEPADAALEDGLKPGSRHPYGYLLPSIFS